MEEHKEEKKRQYSKRYLGNNLKRIIEDRKRFNRTIIADLSHATGIDKKSIYNYINGMEPMASNLLLLSMFFEVSPFDIVNTPPLFKRAKGFYEEDEI